MWEQICATNRDNILIMLNRYIESLEDIRKELTDRDKEGIHNLFVESRDYRNSISDSSQGSLPKSYSLYCDMVDEAGGIAALATILATNGISIKNIGIVNNREFEEGVLQLAFPDKQTLTRAKRLLTDNGYMVHER